MFGNRLFISMILFVFALAAVVSTCDRAGAAELTAGQLRLLHQAEIVGKSVGWEETVQSILLQESSAGMGSRIVRGEKGIGVMQVRPATADYIARIYSQVRRYTRHIEYAAALMDDQYNLLVGALYFNRAYNIMARKFGKGPMTWRRAVVAYNAGITGALHMTDSQINAHPYLRNISKRLRFLRHYRSANL